MKIYRHRISCPLAWLLLETLAAGGGNEAVREKSRVPSAGSSLTRLVGEISSRARALEKAGDLEGALEAWREAGFLLPEDSAVSREVKRVSLGLAKEKLSRAKEELKPEAKGRAAELLLESWDLSPTPDAASFLSKIGYSPSRRLEEGRRSQGL